MADDLSPENIKRLLGQLHNVNERNSTAAALSKVAAKADGARALPHAAAGCLTLLAATAIRLAT